MPITNKTKATIEAITQHCTDTRSFLLRLEKPFSYAAGQFLMVSIPHSNRVVRRAFNSGLQNNRGRSTIRAFTTARKCQCKGALS